MRYLSCRSLRIREKCGPVAASLSETLTSLVAQQIPRIMDAVYHLDGVTPIYLSDCSKLTSKLCDTFTTKRV